MPSDRDKLLGTYLNDHLAGSTVGVELANRARKSNKHTPLGKFLSELAEEIQEDRETLKRVMDTLEIGHDRAKQAAGWLGEKLGRLKPNNRLFGYSPLSRVIELEGLALGVAGKRGLWQSLGAIADPRLSEFDFDALIERADRQRSGLEEQRLLAAQKAFGD
jgi:hypothetical protein